MKKLTHKIVLMTAIAAAVIGLTGGSVKAAEQIDDTGAVETFDDGGAAESFDDGGMAETSQATGIPTPDGLLVSSVFPDEIIPLSFHKTITTYSGQQVEAAQFDNGSVLLLYVTDANGGNDNYKLYDESTGELHDFRTVSGPNDKFIIVLTPTDDIVAPEGFEKAILDWNGQTLYAYINPSAQPLEGSDVMPSEFFLLYGLSNEGKTGWYLYDQVENTYQRYVGLGSTSKSEEDLLDIEAVKEGDNTALIRLIIIGVLALITIILIVVVCVLGHKLSEFNEYEYIDEEDYNATNSRNEHIYNVMSEGTVDDSLPPSYVRMQQDPDALEERGVRDEEDSYYPAPEMPQTDTYQEDETAYIQNAKGNEDTSIKSNDNGEDAFSRSHENSYERASAKSSRRAILETGDIADLDDILNDPDGTSELPLPAQIEMAARAAKDAEKRPEKSPEKTVEQKTADVKEEPSYETMQVTVDRFQAGMPAMVDTKTIAKEAAMPANEQAAPVYNAMPANEQAAPAYYEAPADDQYYGEGNFYPEEPFDPEDDDDWDYISREERKERKAIYKEQMREYKEALKDAKYLEKERKKAEKRKSKGYESPEAMDWGSFKTSMPDGADDSRRPRGNNQDALPSYVRSDVSAAGNAAAAGNAPAANNAQADAARMAAGNAPAEENAYGGYANENPAKELSEEERASAAADAVIRAARGTGHTQETPTDEQIRSEQSYQEYRQGARNTYEEYRRADEAMAAPAPNTDAPGRMNPQFTQDLDDDFEFEFLNIRHPS